MQAEGELGPGEGDQGHGEGGRAGAVPAVS
jgi:hypothetical protein